MENADWVLKSDTRVQIFLLSKYCEGKTVSIKESHTHIHMCTCKHTHSVTYA